MDRTRFIIVGSGWRSLYYVRIAKALPERFELCAMLCRTEEKARLMAAENGIYTTTSEQQCIAFKPDVVVVAVNKASIADVTMLWAKRGFCVLSETPAALESSKLKELWELHRAGCRITVNEQYGQYPTLKSLIDIIKSNTIGEPSCLNISIAHEYHGMNLARQLLDLSQGEQFTIRAREYEFPSTETLSRHEAFFDGRVAMKKRTAATIEFDCGKVAFYDFDSDQYRSPIRRNTVKVQGLRGEIVDDKVHYLDPSNRARTEQISVKTKTVATASTNPNLHEFKEVESVLLGDKVLYEPYFGLCGLSEDETAMAWMLNQTALYGRGLAQQPYPLENALQDAYSMTLMQKACATGQTIRSERQIWN